MISEAVSITLGIIFSSVGLIFFLYYYITQIASFDVEQAIRQSKRADLFEEGHDSYMRASLLQKEPEIENTRFYFNFIFQNVQQFLKEFHSHQTYLVILSSIFFSIIVICLLEEYLGSFYVTISFILGIFFCVSMHYFASKFGRSTLGAIIFQSIEGDFNAFHDTFQTSFTATLALIVLFLSLFNVLIIILTACYRSTYVSDDSHYDEYGQMFTLMMSGFTLAYCFGSFFYRISGTIYQSSVSTTADLISKSDEEIKSDNFFNPCSVPDQVGSFYKNYMSSFSDITSVFLLLSSTIFILVCDSQEFTKEKSSFYFIEVYFSFLILGSLIATVALNIKIFNRLDLINYCVKNYRMQLIVNHIFTFSFNFFVPLIMFENDFSVFMEDGKPVLESITNFQQSNISSWRLVLCLFMGYIAEIVLLIQTEFFSAHIYRPVRSLLDKSENGPCLNLFSIMIISFITYFIPIFLFFFCFFVCYGVLGNFGLALCGIGIIANLIPIFAINGVASLSENALRLGKLSKLYMEDEFKKTPLFIINWSSQNFLMHIRICTFGGFFFGGFALIGCIVEKSKIMDILSLETLQLTGLIFGSFIPFLLVGIILAIIQKLLQSNFIIAKKQFSYFPGIKKGVDKPDFPIIFTEAKFKSILFTFVFFVFNFLLIYFYGLFFGIEGIIGVLISLILTGSYLIYSGFLCGTALSNAKSYADNNNSIEEFGPIAASVSIGEMFSLLVKESKPALMIVIIFDLFLCLLSLRIFAATAWISSAVGLN